MKATEVKVNLADPAEHPVKAYASLTFDREFAVHGIKLVELHGTLHLSMPARKMKLRCPYCGVRNISHAKYCNECGMSVLEVEIPNSEAYRDIAHPVAAGFRKYLERCILAAYEQARLGVDLQKQVEANKTNEDQEAAS